MGSTNPSLIIQQQDEGHHHLHSMSRLSLRTQDHEPLMSIENLDAADEEFSDRDLGRGFPSSDSEKEPGCHSLPATPPRLRRRTATAKLLVSKDYASENESGTARSRVRRRRSAMKDTWPPPVERPSQFSGESDHGGVMVITRPKGGRRSLCMGMEEVKACNDLGFELELEHEHIMPRLSVNTAGAGGSLDFDTSSGNNSPIAGWRVSSPGDDPRDVKARLKVWAQAVAIASTSRKGLDLF